MKKPLHFIIINCLLMLAVVSPSGARDRTKTYKNDACKWLDENSLIFEETAQKIHEYAETALLEYKSADCLTSLLEKGGFTIEHGVAGQPTAFIASYGNGHPVVGILAEYDALPGLSQVPGISRKEAVAPGAPGHGCGHNLFGTGSIAAALALHEVMAHHSISGTVKVFGCPAEETVIGKVYMARAGVFDGLDICLTWHPSAKNRANLSSTLAMNSFEVTFHGRTAHGAVDPWNGRSALDAVELMNIGVNYLREHVKPTVRIHYVIPDGGRAPNIVPDYARVWYYVRDVDRHGVEDVYSRVLKCAEGAVLMTGTDMEVKLITGVYNYLPNRTISEVLDKNLREIGPPQFTETEQAFAREIQKELGIAEDGLSEKIEPFREEDTTGSGSTDVADVSWIVPTGGELSIAAAPLNAPWHSWVVTSCAGSSMGFKAMHTAAEVIAVSAIDFLVNDDLVGRARKEFIEKTEDFVYRSAVPEGSNPPLPAQK